MKIRFWTHHKHGKRVAVVVCANCRQEIARAVMDTQAPDGIVDATPGAKGGLLTLEWEDTDGFKGEHICPEEHA